MTGGMLMRLASKYSPTANCLWLLKRAMYGLKHAPALWQTHFVKVMTEFRFHRCNADSNLHCHSSTELFVLCYVEDFLVCGTRHTTKKFPDRQSKEVPLKVERELRPQTSANYPSRTLKHNGDSIYVSMPTAHASDMLKM